MGHRLTFVWNWIDIGRTGAPQVRKRFLNVLLCIAASSATQRNSDAGQPKRFEHKAIFRIAQLTVIGSAPAATNMFAALPNFAQELRKKFQQR
jgi:hypothetical protein